MQQANAILAAAEGSGKRLMVAYMKRYDAGNELVKRKIDEFRASDELGPITFARNHGFCGDWVAGLDMPTETSEEPIARAQAVASDDSFFLARSNARLNSPIGSTLRLIAEEF